MHLLSCKVLLINELKTYYLKMAKPKSKPDLLWKDLLAEFDAEFIEFFLGKKLHDSIDFSVEPEFLEQELNDTFAANEPNKKITDKIVRYSLKNGKFRFIIIHIEFQGKSEKDFAERMFRYFVYIYLKYGSTDITALALYTGASRPNAYSTFTVSVFGTKLTYQFNTYTVREKDETELEKSDNPFALAVLASLYLIKAGKDPNQKLAYKKKLIEIARTKNFDFAKLYRLINFVEYLITLPKELELEFKIFSHQPKIEKKMEADKEFLETYSNILGIKKAIKEFREEGREEGREELIMNIHNKMGFSAKQIANMTNFSVEYIQGVIEKHENSKR